MNFILEILGVFLIAAVMVAISKDRKFITYGLPGYVLIRLVGIIADAIRLANQH
jgi:hypothetical protein